jgi:hypothetical protein
MVDVVVVMAIPGFLLHSAAADNDDDVVVVFHPVPNKW